MDPISKEGMGNATSMFNLMRNLGGSFGIAAATTFLFRRQQLHTNLLGARVTAFNPAARAMSKGLQSTMVAHGSDPVTAVQQAYVATWGLVERQASMLSFVDTFLAMGVVFLLVLPLLLVMKRPRHTRGGAAMH
jgi:DHA2 family multidrug resistance protein